MAKKPKHKITNHQKVARRLAGIEPGTKLPKKGTPARRAYDSAMRATQRADAAGRINPKTGKAPQSRPSRKAKAAAETLRAEEKALRKPTVTLRNMTVLTTINGDRRYQRRRALGDVTMTRQQFRAMRKLDRDQDDELLAELIANVSDVIEDLSVAPGIETLDISEIVFSGID